jgi:hypothetical protein
MFCLLCLLYSFFADPLKREITNNIKNRKKHIFAIVAAPPAIPPNPKIPAMIAIITNVIVQRNIILNF